MRLLLLLAASTLAGCSTTGSGRSAQEASPQAEAGGSVSFKVDVVSDNRQIARFLEDNLELQRYTDFPDLRASELARLLGEAEENARDLLAARGYFNPKLQLRADPPEDPGGKRHVVIEVDPGRLSDIGSVEISFAEPMNSDPSAEEQREAIRRDWLLEAGKHFSQVDWDAAKAAGLRALQKQRYPAARIETSQAIADEANSQVDLQITYDAGLPYRFGPLVLKEVERYDAEGIRNIARIPTGEEYDEDALLSSQRRLSSSGYFDSAFLVLDTASDPQNATVVAQLREAQYQKMVFGLGYSTDAGARVSIDYTHNEMWPLDWRAVNNLTVGTQGQSLATQWTDMPKASGWAWYTGVTLERADYGDHKTNSGSLTGGRTRSLAHADHRFYLQYDASSTHGIDAADGSSSLIGNYEWTGNYFNDRVSPTSGFGLGAEGGLGLTVTPHRNPFARVVLRAMKFWPFGRRNSAGQRDRIALRGETGGVFADRDTDVPVRLLFLTGGDTTIRGYAYQSIGSRQQDGSVFGARYLAMTSLEWQNPVTLFGDASSWEHVVFVDAGTAADRVHDARLFTGVGTGMRWRSPVGPMELDLAYGTRVDKWRVHIRVGFQF
jgi:translocation and assembly module TamA